MQQRLVRVNSLGLAIPPPRLDCVEGQKHSELVGNQSCFVDEHHLYFSRERFDNHQNDLVREFATHPFNRIKMARCRHVQYHQIHSRTLIPPKEVMIEFLQEAAILQRLGVVVKALTDLEESLFTPDPRKAARNESRYLRIYDEFDEEKSELIPVVQNLEVIPSNLILSGLSRFVKPADLAQYSPELLST